jgi:hypothetical protein
MATDEEYMAFLDKANADPSAGVAKKQSRSQQARLKTVDREEDIPVRLREVTKDAFYVSDADEPFEPVCLRLMDGEDTLPDEGAFLRGPPLGYSLLGSYLLIWVAVGFAKLVQHPSPEEAEVEIMDVARWDVRGQYKELVDATRDATKGSDVMVYRVERGGPRVEYWLVGVEGGKLLGVKALAVES